MLMKKYALLFCHICILCGMPLYAQDLKIDAAGNYISSERISLESPSSIYEVSGKIRLERLQNGQEAYLLIGLSPFGRNGEKLQEVDDFPDPAGRESDGYILLDAIVFDKSGTFDFLRKIKLCGENLKQVSFVVGAYLEKGAVLTVSDLKLAPQNNPQAGIDKPSPSILSEKSVGYKKIQNADARIGLSADGVGLREEIDGRSTMPKGSAEDFRRTIYVNSEIGSDKFQGLKRARGQSDGPKKTVKSALDSSASGDNIVLQRTKTPYKIATIKTKPGGNLAIRAEGAVVIRAE